MRAPQTVLLTTAPVNRHAMKGGGAVSTVVWAINEEAMNCLNLFVLMLMCYRGPKDKSTWALTVDAVRDNGRLIGFKCQLKNKGKSAQIVYRPSRATLVVQWNPVPSFMRSISPVISKLEFSKILPGESVTGEVEVLDWMERLENGRAYVVRVNYSDRSVNVTALSEKWAVQSAVGDVAGRKFRIRLVRGKLFATAI